MATNWYGNIMNRLEEKAPSAPIKVGTDITMYLWSDRNCYYVTDVIDDKHIKVKRYHVIADLDKDGGMGHQNWVYFKSAKECNDYFRAHGKEGHRDESIIDREETWAYRYGKWTHENVCTDARFADTERERKAIEKNGFFKYYTDLSGSVRFGVRDYYYDWSF